METQNISEVVELTYSELIALADILQIQTSGQSLTDSMRDHVLEETRKSPEKFSDNDEDIARFLGSTVPRMQFHARGGCSSLRKRGLIEETDDEEYTITNKVLNVYARVLDNPHIKVPFHLVHKSPGSPGVEKHRTYNIAPDLPILEETLGFPVNPPDRNPADPKISLRCIPDSTALIMSWIDMLAPLRSKTPITHPDWYHPIKRVIDPSWVETFYRQFPHVLELLRDVDIPDGIARRLTDVCVDANTYYGVIPDYFSSSATSSDWYDSVFAIPASSKSENNYIWLIQIGQFTSDTPNLNVKMVDGVEAIKAIGDHAVEALKQTAMIA